MAWEDTGTPRGPQVGGRFILTAAPGPRASSPRCSTLSRDDGQASTRSRRFPLQADAGCPLVLANLPSITHNSPNSAWGILGEILGKFLESSWGDHVCLCRPIPIRGFSFQSVG